ncbi:hypothetical protein ABEF95_009833 [Exophiala dermatitidis]
MTRRWPPSPCVEDEDVALAKEHGPGSQLRDLKSEDQPASSRGLVDQFPIIIDTQEPSTTPTDGQTAGTCLNPVPGNVSSTEGVTDPSSSATNHEKRFVYLPSQDSETESAHRPEPIPRSKSATRLAEHEARKARPQIPRLQTDLGIGHEGMVTGHGRAPSPYAYRPSAPTNTLSAGAQNGNTLLSPMDANGPKRHLSARPSSRVARHEDLDSDHSLRSRRKSHRSRSRHEAYNPSNSDRSDSERLKSSATSEKLQRSPSTYSRRGHRHHSPAASLGGSAAYSYTAEHITPPQTPKLGTERPSVVDHSLAAGTTHGRFDGRRIVADSPCTSSAEEAHIRRHRSDDERRATRRGRSRRGSRSHAGDEAKSQSIRGVSTRRDRAITYDSTDESQSSESHRRRQRRTPRGLDAMEDYFAKAFVANQHKQAKHGETQSRAVSPLTSPPQSPPRTPRSERSSKNYFELPPASSVKHSRQRSRPPSWDDSHFKDIKPLTSLLGAATLGASLAAKANPALSRSSTSHSSETPGSSSQSRPGSGQRSRKPSPVSEEPPSLSHSITRTNSTAIRDEPRATRTTYTVHESRAIPIAATYSPTTGLEPPRSGLRAASYSHSQTFDHARPPVLYRAHSSTSSPSSQMHQSPVHFLATQTVASAPVTPEPASFLPPSSRPTAPPACPRSRPVAGLQDWYTIRDLPYLDFCPTCMGFLGATRFRDHFIPSRPKDPRQPVACAMSLPWIRVAWLQSIKQDRKDLTLVWQISIPPPPETRPCSGHRPDIRRWYHLTDPRTGRPLENFDICSACVRNLDLIFPALQSHLFDRPPSKPSQEKVCSMNTSSRHFSPIISELERLAERREKEQLRQRDILDFVDFIRRISRHRECAKSTMLATTSWHYISDLPELTICEECFEEVVWPLRDRPIARDVSKTLKLVPPLRRNNLVPGISCQLYSDRMRRIFYEAVSKNNFEILRTAAKQRYSMEHRLQEMQKLYEMDQRAGIDRRAEMEKNNAIWKSIE